MTAVDALLALLDLGRTRKVTFMGTSVLKDSKDTKVPQIIAKRMEKLQVGENHRII